MKRFLFASLVALGALSFTAATGASALAFPTKAPASMPKLASEPIVQVHGYHCRAAWSRRWGSHRHVGACRNWRRSQYQRRYYQQRRYYGQSRYYDLQRYRNEQRRRSQR